MEICELLCVGISPCLHRTLDTNGGPCPWETKLSPSSAWCQFVGGIWLSKGSRGFNLWQFWSWRNSLPFVILPGRTSLLCTDLWTQMVSGKHERLLLRRSSNRVGCLRKSWMAEKSTHLCPSSHTSVVCFYVMKLLDCSELWLSSFVGMFCWNISRGTCSVQEQFWFTPQALLVCFYFQAISWPHWEDEREGRYLTSERWEEGTH